MVDGIKEPGLGKQLPGIDPSILTAAAALTVTNLTALITGGQSSLRNAADGPGGETHAS